MTDTPSPSDMSNDDEMLARLRKAIAGRYSIERELGRGGMATVFLARDLKHGRQVAIKVLNADLANSVGAERFLREIRTTADLVHPNIVPLYDSGEADGMLFYIMPYITGETLRDKLDREKQLSFNDALRLMHEIASALDYAHARGIIHRDIKPENVLITDSARAMVLDFGLSRALFEASSHGLTATGLVVGTPSYISPEQAEADRTIDGRADIYSLGCMLFEMLAGERPFHGKTYQAVINRHIMDERPSLRSRGVSAPASVEHAVARAMARVPAERFKTAGEFVRALDANAQPARRTGWFGLAPVSLEEIKQRKIVQWALAYLSGGWLLLQIVQILGEAYDWPSVVLRIFTTGLIVGLLATLVLAWYHGEKGANRVSAPELVMIAGILILAGTAIAFVGRKDSARVAGVAVAAERITEQGSIGVLPFLDMSPDKNEKYFSDGLTEELLNVLAQIPELRVAARTSSFSFRDKDVAIDSIARALHVEYVLEGSVRTAERRVRITAQLIKAATGYHVWSNTYDRDVKDVFAVQEEISRAIVQALRVKLRSGQDTLGLAQAGTSDPEAHALVLKGIFAYNQKTRQTVAQSATYFQQAIARDSSYAAAYAGLANTYYYSAYRRFGPPDEYYKRALETANHALQLDPDVAKAHLVLGRVTEVHLWKFQEAEEHFRRAIEINPAYAEAYAYRGWLLMRLGHPQESLESVRRAAVLDPVSVPVMNSLASMELYSGQIAAGLEHYAATVALQANAIVYANYAVASVRANKPADAVKFAEESLRLAPNDPYGTTAAALAYAKAGRRADAEAMLRNVLAQPDASPFQIATMYVELGDREQAFKYLDKALAQHDDYMPDLGVDPNFDPLRNDARMAELLKKIGVPSVRQVSGLK